MCDLIENFNLKFNDLYRYDHYATLCELMTMALPTLKSCLQVFMKSDNQSTGMLSAG